MPCWERSAFLGQSELLSWARKDATFNFHSARSSVRACPPKEKRGVEGAPWLRDAVITGAGTA